MPAGSLMLFDGVTLAAEPVERTMTRGASARRWLVRIAMLAAGGIAGLIVLYVLVVYAGGWLVNTGVVLLSRGLVWLMVSMAEGVDLWALVAQIGRGLSGALTTPTGAGALIALEVVAVLALYALHRVLRASRQVEESREARE